MCHTCVSVRLNNSWTAVELARHVAACDDTMSAGTTIVWYAVLTWVCPTGGTVHNVTETLSGIHL